MHTLSPYIKNRLTDCAKIWRVARYPNVTRFTKIGGWVTAHTHVRLQFRCHGNRWALSLKSHQKQVYFFRARSFIAKQGVLLVNIDCESLIFCEQIRGKTKNTTFSQNPLTLAPLGGGGQRAPLWFFANSSWSTGNFALKLAIPLRATILHIVSKNYDPGHNRSAVSDVRVTSCFADFDQRNGFKGIAATGAVLKLRLIDLYELT